jgi:hypothetical protein
MFKFAGNQLKILQDGTENSCVELKCIVLKYTFLTECFGILVCISSTDIKTEMYIKRTISKTTLTVSGHIKFNTRFL